MMMTLTEIFYALVTCIFESICIYFCFQMDPNFCFLNWNLRNGEMCHQHLTMVPMWSGNMNCLTLDGKLMSCACCECTNCYYNPFSPHLHTGNPLLWILNLLEWNCKSGEKWFIFINGRDKFILMNWIEKWSDLDNTSFDIWGRSLRNPAHPTHLENSPCLVNSPSIPSVEVTNSSWRC